jgi:hypothetical protein
MTKHSRLVLLVSAFAAVLSLAVTSPAWANKYINDINWSAVPCVQIPDLVRRLDAVGDALEQSADQAEAQGNQGLANTLNQAANEAHVEADEGRLHYEMGDCK